MIEEMKLPESSYFNNSMDLIFPKSEKTGNEKSLKSSEATLKVAETVK